MRPSMFGSSCYFCMWDRFYLTSWMLDSKRDNKTKTKKLACLLLILFSRKKHLCPVKKKSVAAVRSCAMRAISEKTTTPLL